MTPVSPSQITDELTYNELAYTIYMKTKQAQKAEETAKELLKLQPQNWRYYELLKQANPNFDLSVYNNSLV